MLDIIAAVRMALSQKVTVRVVLFFPITRSINKTNLPAENVLTIYVNATVNAKNVLKLTQTSELTGGFGLRVLTISCLVSGVVKLQRP